MITAMYRKETQRGIRCKEKSYLLSLYIQTKKRMTRNIEKNLTVNIIPSGISLSTFRISCIMAHCHMMLLRAKLFQETYMFYGSDSLIRPCYSYPSSKVVISYRVFVFTFFFCWVWRKSFCFFIKVS